MKTTKHKLWMLLFCLFVLTACSIGESTVSYAPQDSVNLEKMAEEYPLQYNGWETSVHGEAYLTGDHNAPACLDCHDDPATGEAKTAAFHLEIPNRCARCHADEELMIQYDISADVYDTYISDYHGTTIAYYQAVDPEEHRYEAVCSDCHGSHSLFAVDDQRSSVYPDNLTATCQTCHHDASEKFSSAFGHYRPAREPVSKAESPVLFWVKLFYQVLIPVALGGMLMFIGLDLLYRLKSKRSKSK